MSGRPSARVAVLPTQDEILLLSLIACGHQDAEIALQFRRPLNTVKHRILRLKRRLRVEDRAHLVAQAYRQGLLTAYPASFYERAAVEEKRKEEGDDCTTERHVG